MERPALPDTLPESVYMVGVCGTGMGALAMVLRSRGLHVVGSDQAAWAPMGPMLHDAGVEIRQPYSAYNIADAKFAIIGNAVGASHPEVLAIQAANLPYVSMPEALHHYILRDRPVYVAAGTHGKTTCSAMLAHLLQHVQPADNPPGYLIGGLPVGWRASGAFGGNSAPFAIEGDEYSSSFWDHGPKFAHYRATAIVLPSLEYDHADVYPTEEAYLETFERWMASLPQANIVYDCNYPAAVRMLTGHPRAVGLGNRRQDRLTIDNVHTTADGMMFDMQLEHQRFEKFRVPMMGQHNVRNAAQVLALLLMDGYDATQLREGLASFPGIAKRQTLLFDEMQRTVVFDFGHHPTEIAATLAALRNRWPDRRLTAVFEPRSFSSRRNIHQQGFNGCFRDADRLWLAPVFRAEAIAEGERLDVSRMANLHSNGTAFEDVAELAEAVLQPMESDEVIVFFSNGDFEDLPARCSEVQRQHLNANPPDSGETRT